VIHRPLLVHGDTLPTEYSSVDPGGFWGDEGNSSEVKALTPMAQRTLSAIGKVSGIDELGSPHWISCISYR